MPKKAKKKTQKGAGFKDVLKAVGRVAHDTKAISKGLSLIPNPIAQGASFVADQLGYGRVHRVHGAPVSRRLLPGAIQSLPTHPGSSLDVLTHPAGFVVGSSVKPPLSHCRLAHRKVRKMKGGGLFSDIGGGVGKALGGLGSGIGSVLGGLFG
jgi:hypothetical protein